MSDDPFVTHRGLLFTIAYEMLGSAADAEDVVQETWLRWADVERDSVHDPRAYLARIVTRQALNRLRTLARRREDYIGPWLPEPLLTTPNVADDLELAESISMAMLTVLETLTPIERAVFVLREVFDLPHAEVAATVGKSPVAVRQIAHRAREHVSARRPRVAVDRREQQRVVEKFLAALTTGDLDALMGVLAPDVAMIADSGGVVGGPRRPVQGAKRLATLLSKLGELAPSAAAEPAWINGQLGARISIDDKLDTILSFVVEAGRITRMYAVRNPAKLAHLDRATALSR